LISASVTRRLLARFGRLLAPGSRLDRRDLIRLHPVRAERSQLPAVGLVVDDEVRLRNVMAEVLAPPVYLEAAVGYRGSNPLANYSTRLRARLRITGHEDLLLEEVKHEVT